MSGHVAGLVVPVIRDADKKAVAEIPKKVIDGASAARSNAHFGALLVDMRRMIV